jgi:hypothetical protein
MSVGLIRRFDKNEVLFITDEVDSEDDLLIAFSDGERGHEGCYAETLERFVGTALHLMQQGTGNLYINGVRCYANRMEDTSGEVDIEELDIIVSFKDLLKE